MNDAAFEQRMGELRQQKAHIQFSPSTFKSLMRLLRSVFTKMDEIDPSILDLNNNRVVELTTLLSQEKPVLSHFDLFDLERISLVSERYYKILGGQQQLGMTAEQQRSLTVDIGQKRKQVFPKAGKSA